MKLEESFEVDAPVEEVWRALTDIERIAPCLPGAEVTEASEDGTYHGSFQVKLGPTTAAYRGTLKMESLDEETHTATMSANGRDKRGQGSAKATMVSRVSAADGGGSRVQVDTDFTITGRLARFGRGGMIEDISRRLLGEFAACLQKEIRGAGAPAAGAATDTTDVAEHDGAGEGAPPRGGGQASATSRAPAASTAPQRTSEPVRGFYLFLSVLRERIRRLLGKRRG